MNCTENIILIRVALPFKCLIEFIERERFLKNCFRGCSGSRISCAVDGVSVVSIRVFLFSTEVGKA